MANGHRDKAGPTWWVLLAVCVAIIITNIVTLHLYVERHGRALYSLEDAALRLRDTAAVNKRLLHANNELLKGLQQEVGQ